MCVSHNGRPPGVCAIQIMSEGEQGHIYAWLPVTAKKG